MDKSFILLGSTWIKVGEIWINVATYLVWYPLLSRGSTWINGCWDNWSGITHTHTHTRIQQNLAMQFISVIYLYKMSENITVYNSESSFDFCSSPQSEDV